MIGTTRAPSRWSTSCSSRTAPLQDDDVYKFASDMYADQTTEIERMQKMLAAGGQRSHQ